MKKVPQNIRKSIIDRSKLDEELQYYYLINKENNKKK